MEVDINSDEDEQQMAEWWNIYGNENTETDCRIRVEEFNPLGTYYETGLSLEETWDLSEENYL